MVKLDVYRRGKIKSNQLYKEIGNKAVTQRMLGYSKNRHSLDTWIKDFETNGCFRLLPFSLFIYCVLNSNLFLFLQEYHMLELIACLIMLLSINSSDLMFLM